MSWSELGEWWMSELAGDPAYESVVTPLLLSILRPEPGLLYLDLGSGEGRVIRAVGATGATAHGVELNPELARRSAQAGPTLVGELPASSFIADSSYDGAYCVLVLEHIADHERLFAEMFRVVRPEGVLAVVMNHPVWTAPGSTPISDVDGETLWRPGAYFSRETLRERAGSRTVEFHHRTTADLLNGAADAGWVLGEMVEAPHHAYEDQIGIPRLLAVRWVKPPG